MNKFEHGGGGRAGASGSLYGEQTDRHYWKHYSLATSLVIGNKITNKKNCKSNLIRN